MRCAEAPDEAAAVSRPADRSGAGPFGAGVRLNGDFFGRSFLAEPFVGLCAAAACAGELHCGLAPSFDGE